MSSADPLIDRQLGPYRILRKLGAGGMASVYLADQASMQRQVAIKVLPAAFMLDEQFLARFQREVKIIASLEHPRILPVYDFGEIDGQPYIVMRYLSGGSLSEELARHPGGLPIERVVQVVDQIGEGLDFAHRKGIIHRDFKPSNVLLDGEGYCYLADFGIAKVSADTAALTGSGIIGTPSYMAPEAANQERATSALDVYALGITLFQLLTGNSPYKATTPMGILMAHISEPIPDIRPRRPDLPPAIQEVIAHATAKHPEQRTPSAGRVAAELRAALDQPAPAFTPLDTLIEEDPFGVPTPSAVPGPLRPPAPPAPTPRPAPTAGAQPQASAPPRRALPGWAIALIGLGGLGALTLVAVIAVALLNPWGPGASEEATEIMLSPALEASPTPLPVVSPTPLPPPTALPSETPSLPPVTISPLCSFYGESPQYISYGAPLILRWTWTAASADLVQDHIDAGIYRILLDGVEVSPDRRSEIYYRSEDGVWAVSWEADRGLLARGEHLSERYLTWTRQISDGWNSFGPGGEIESEYDYCQIIVQ